MKRLIINADDYGRTPDISRGIREAHLHGVVTSTTCMMNIPTTAADISLALQETPDLGMGVHLVLTTGRPLSAPESIPSIVDAHGDFLKYTPFLEQVPHLDLHEVEAEWRAQIESFIKAARQKPTHLDSHHHSSYWSPGLFQAMLALAIEYGCAIRFPFTQDAPYEPELDETSQHVPELMRGFAPRRPELFIREFYDENATRETLLRVINGLGEGTSEIMCHPGHVDDAFAEASIYNWQRERELTILTEPSIEETIQANGIQLITFAEL